MTPLKQWLSILLCIFVSLLIQIQIISSLVENSKLNLVCLIREIYKMWRGSQVHD